MANKVDIWMPLYVADYLSATSRLTTEQHGAYLLLLMDYWKNGAPPNNDAVLAQITKLSPDAWSNARTMLGLSFLPHLACAPALPRSILAFLLWLAFSISDSTLF